MSLLSAGRVVATRGLDWWLLTIAEGGDAMFSLNWTGVVVRVGITCFNGAVYITLIDYWLVKFIHAFFATVQFQMERPTSLVYVIC